MTITTPQPGRLDFRLVTYDLYRNIHKGIRSELFALTEQAGRVDATHVEDRAALAVHVRSVVDFLGRHAEHEDAGIQPALEEHLPALAEEIASDHERLERRTEDLQALAAAIEEEGSDRRGAVHRLYLELGSFTSAYLEHQDVEERVVMPALEASVGPEAVMVMHQGIVGAIPPDEMARSMAIMLPAMNLDDRSELLGGMQQGAPPEVFAAIWSLAGSVLAERDHLELGQRLGLA